MNLDKAESTHNTKVSESGYSNSGNSRSQWSCSGRSYLSSSSGYGTRGYTKPDAVAIKAHRLIKRAKNKNRKKKKTKCSAATTITGSNIRENVPLLESENSKTDQVLQPGVEPTETAASSSNPEDTIDKKGDSSSFMDGDAVQTSIRWSSQTQLETNVESQETWISVEDQLQSAASGSDSDSGFCCVISMQDGAVLFTTPNITQSLGFPRDMWLGRSFIDFVHPQDRATFANQITSNVVITLGDSSNGRSNRKDQTNYLYVMLRKYRGLRSAGFGITKSTVSYQPYRLNLMFREVPVESNEIIQQNDRNIVLVISATPVYSIYEEPNEALGDKELRFSTRHTIGGVLKYVDGNSVESIGYLPQDILGRSILELYHPEDISIFKKACESAINKGQMARSWISQPCRFLIKNGCYILLQTKWTSFINPWTKEIEFIIGNHHVLKGPSNPDVFAGSSLDQTLNNFPEELLKEAKSIEEQIVQMLKKPVTDAAKNERSLFAKKCKPLTTFMEELMNEMAASKPKFNLPSDSDITSSKRDSMIIGEMSPHHEGITTSDTLLSYNQLNYNDNIQRFFDSCPTNNVSDQLKPGTSVDVNLILVGDKRSTAIETPNTTVCGLSSNVIKSGPSQFFRPRALTEELLYKHNADMQKVMLKKHRDAQVLARDGIAKEHIDQVFTAVESHGIKRGPSFSWEDDSPKPNKQQHNFNSQVVDKPLNTSKVPATCTSTIPRDIVVTTTAVTIKPQLAKLSYTLPGVGEVWPPIAALIYNVDGGFQLRENDGSTPRKPRDAPPPAIDETNEDMDVSSLSSFYSSFLKTDDNTSDSDEQTKRTPANDAANWESASRVKRRPNPPWLDNVTKTKDLIYRYQVDERSVQELLAADLDVLNGFNQPILVNEQLDQLYLDLEGAGMTTRLALSETSSGGISSNSSDDGESSQCHKKQARRSTKYSKLMMVYEENAPFPPPLSRANMENAL